MNSIKMYFSANCIRFGEEFSHLPSMHKHLFLIRGPSQLGQSIVIEALNEQKEKVRAVSVPQNISD